MKSSQPKPTPKSAAKRRPVRDITKFRGLAKIKGKPMADEELDRARYEYLAEKHGPLPPYVPKQS